jgi:hypothetical protein
VQEGSAGRDLDAALARLVDSVVRAVEPAADVSAVEGLSEDTVAPSAPAAAERARRLAQALAVGLRELVRAPLREALQAGYDLGYRAGQEAQRQASGAEGTGPAESPMGSPASHQSASESSVPSSVAVPPSPDSQATADNEVLVEVGPFPSFSAVNRFHAAVAAAPGVVEATIATFRDGQLSLRVIHPDGATLAAALMGLGLGPLRVVRADRDRLELALVASGATQPHVGSRGADDETIEMERPEGGFNLERH